MIGECKEVLREPIMQVVNVNWGYKWDEVCATLRKEHETTSQLNQNAQYTVLN